MMKFYLAFLVALALCVAVSARAPPLKQPVELSRDFQEFIDLLPKEEIKALVSEYVKKDNDVLIASMFLEGDGFRNAVRILDSMDDMLEVYAYLQETGVDAYSILNKIHEALLLPAFVPGRSARSVRITSGVAGLMADVSALLPVYDIKDLFHKKLETSSAFVYLIERLRSPRFHELLENLRANEDFQRILQYLKNHDINVRAILDLLHATFGPEFPSIPTGSA